jgi:hypothetical protein
VLSLTEDLNHPVTAGVPNHHSVLEDYMKRRIFWEPAQQKVAIPGPKFNGDFHVDLSKR